MSNNPKTGQFCWNELATPNLQASKDFYSKVFGWTFKDMEMGDMTYTTIHNGNEANGLGGIWSIPTDQQEMIPPHWMSYILVENVDNSLEVSTKNGATIIKPAFDVGNFGRMGIITDPTGAHIALWQQIGDGKQC